MIYDMDAKPLMEKLQLASDKESAAVKSLLLYMQSGGQDEQMLMKLTEDMENTHAEKMDIYNQLQAFRLDK